MHYHIDEIIHSTAFGISAMEHWLEWGKKQIIGSPRRFDPATHIPKAGTLLTELNHTPKQKRQHIHLMNIILAK